MIKAVLFSLPIYFLSLFKIPQGIADTMERLMRDFLLGGDHDSSSQLVRWEEVIKPKHRGLDIGNLIFRNKLLLVKWLWHFTRERNVMAQDD